MSLESLSAYTVRIARNAGYACQPPGKSYYFPPGDHQVPRDMPFDIAKRCISSGVGERIPPAPGTQLSPPKAKKRATKKKQGSTGAGKKP